MFRLQEERINFPKTELGVSPDVGFEEIRDFDCDADEAEVYLKFKFPSYEEYKQIQKEKGNDNNTFSSNVVLNCEIAGEDESSSGKRLITSFIGEQETFPFPLKEDNDENRKGNCEYDENDFPDNNLEEACAEKEDVIFDEKFTIEKVENFGGSDKFVSITDYDSDSDSDSESTSFEEHVMGGGGESDCEETKGNGSEKNSPDREVKSREDDDEFVTTEWGKDSSNQLESLWEHQELIEQLKMELKKVRATGLPTILEESETPKIMEDLKPWKIEDFHRSEDYSMGELHKFYKSYRERMRKLDIICYQKMYATGFLQLRGDGDPLQFMSKHKSKTPTLKSLMLQNLSLFRNKIHGSDPMKKFIKEVEGDLEVVYVGQMCLSWEFLHWQYEKALGLWDSDPLGMRRYNKVAGEFQQFQVLLQRFIEDEPFQGLRMQNYVKNRCLLRNLVQVPVIREDKRKDQGKGCRKQDRDEYVITSDMLLEILEESIRIFWRFVRADKYTGHQKFPELGNPEDMELLAETRKVLQKKERKLKDVLRGEQCVVRKLRRYREEDDDSDPALYFFAQVDMKLVRRVLNMSKITREQLIWCGNKLNRISFVGRKICVEPVFLLFPS